MSYKLDINNPVVKKNVLIFIIGLLSVIKVRFLGTFAISEVVAICFLPFVHAAESLRHRNVLILIVMGLLWLVGLVVADIVNDSSTENALKGAFSIIFLIGAVPFVYWLLHDNVKRILYFWCGVAVASIVVIYFPIGYINNADNLDYFRIYNILPAAVASGGLLYYKGYRRAAYVFCLAFGIFALFQESRHIFLLMNLVVALAVTYDMLHKAWSGRFVRYRMVFAVGMLTVMCVVTGLSAAIYSEVASRGYMGERAKTKYELQSNSNIGLLSGRRDFLISLYAGMCNPLIGYGSYAEDEYNFTAKVINSIEDPEDASDYMYGWSSSKLIRTHSHILGAWVHGGIFGLLFWIYVLVMIVAFLRKKIVCSGQLFFFYGLSTAFIVWDILFSPFASRMLFSVYFVSVLILLRAGRLPLDSTDKPLVVSCG